LSNIGNLVDINKRKGLPRTYRFNQFARWFTLLLGSFALVYSIWFIFNKIEADTRFIQKLIPFLILFFTLNSVMKNLLSINSIRFQEDSIIFRFLARKNVMIPWTSITKISYSSGRLRAIRISYKVNEELKVFLFPISFPNMLEIVNSMAEMLPDIEYDDFMQNVIISDKEKEHIRAYDKKQS
jgi:hypothetical protein